MPNETPRICPACQQPVPDSADVCPVDGTRVPGAESQSAPAAPATVQGFDPFIGYELVGRYRLLERIGQGGFATVYRAETIDGSVPVAVKLITRARRDDETAAKRFDREGQVLNAFSHPNAVGCVECGVTDEGLAYIVMEYVEGELLRHVIANEAPLALPRVEAFLLQVGAAITAAHAAGIVHRDLKPENVMIVQTASGAVAKVLDFGVARLQSAEAADGRITSNDLIVGTPRYLPPEALIEGVQTEASDVYALGIIAFEMLTGRVPFEPKIGENSLELAIRLAKQPPPPPSSFNPHLSEEIDAVILRAISRGAADRYPTPSDFAEALASAVKAVLLDAPLTDALGADAHAGDPVLSPNMATVVGMPGLPDDPVHSPDMATVVGMPGLPDDPVLSPNMATVVGMPGLPEPLPPPAAATIVGMPAIAAEPGMTPNLATVVGMPALPVADKPAPAVGMETVVGLPAAGLAPEPAPPAAAGARPSKPAPGPASTPDRSAAPSRSVPAAGGSKTGLLIGGIVVLVVVVLVVIFLVR